MAACMMRMASASSLTEPMCQPPSHRIDTRWPVRPSTRVGSPVAEAGLWLGQNVLCERGDRDAGRRLLQKFTPCR